MTNDLSDEALAARIAEERPDIVGATAITPSIYKAEGPCRSPRKSTRGVTLLGGVHATFMFKQVLSEAPWIDAIVRGEGEEILVEVVRAIDSGEWTTRRRAIKGLAFTEEAARRPSIVATEAAPTVKDFDAIIPDWGILEWSKYKYIPLNCRVAIPNMARGCPFTCSFCSQWKFWRDYRVRDPKKVVDEIETALREIRRPVLHPRRRGADDQPQEIRPVLRGADHARTAGQDPVGHQHPRDRHSARRASCCRSTARRASCTCRSAPKPRRNSNSTASTRRPKSPTTRKRSSCFATPASSSRLSSSSVSRTRPQRPWKRPTGWRMDWKPDLANWSMYTPWPFTKLYQEMSDKVQVFDFEKYNFVTPIIKPEAMERGELLDRVMNNYRRFYIQKALFSYPWAGTGQRRRYLLGCLKAFLKAGFERKFYDLGKVGYWGPQSRKKVDFHFDETRTIARRAGGRLAGERRPLAQGAGGHARCEGMRRGNEQMAEADDASRNSFNLTAAGATIGGRGCAARRPDRTKCRDTPDRGVAPGHGRRDRRTHLHGGGCAGVAFRLAGDNDRRARAARLHKATRRCLGPRRADRVLREAGSLTADYLLRARIPAWARFIFGALPPGPAARVLTRAISRMRGHSWERASSPTRSTAGSTYEIRSNPLYAGETATEPLLCVARCGVPETVSGPGVSRRESERNPLLRARGRLLPVYPGLATPMSESRGTGRPGGRRGPRGRIRREAARASPRSAPPRHFGLRDRPAGSHAVAATGRGQIPLWWVVDKRLLHPSATRRGAFRDCRATPARGAWHRWGSLRCSQVHALSRPGRT